MLPNLENLKAGALDQGHPVLLGPVRRREEMHHGKVAAGLRPCGPDRRNAVVADEQFRVPLLHGCGDVLEDAVSVLVVPVVEDPVQEVRSATCLRGVK